MDVDEIKVEHFGFKRDIQRESLSVELNHST